MGSSRVQVYFTERAPPAGGGGASLNNYDIGSLSQEPRQSDASSLSALERREGEKRKEGEIGGRSNSLTGFIPEEAFFFFPSFLHFLEKHDLN